MEVGWGTIFGGKFRLNSYIMICSRIEAGISPGRVRRVSWTGDEEEFGIGIFKTPGLLLLFISGFGGDFGGLPFGGAGLGDLESILAVIWLLILSCLSSLSLNLSILFWRESTLR